MDSLSIFDGTIAITFYSTVKKSDMLMQRQINGWWPHW